MTENTENAVAEEKVEKVEKDPNSFKVSESKEKGCRAIGLSYDFGATTQAAVDKFGEDVVHGFWLRGVKVALQGHIRSLMKEGKSDAEILAALESWVPGVKVKRSGGGRRKKTAKELYDEMSPEDQQAFLAELMG